MSTIENIVKSLAYATEHNQGLHLTHEEVPALNARIAELEAHIAALEEAAEIEELGAQEAERKEFCPNCEAVVPCTHEAELFVCDICGEDFAKYIVSRNCNVSDVSMTQDVLTDIKTPSSIENTNPDYYKQELARIAELEAERRWIPVSERLPKEKQSVLALDRTGTAYHWEYSRSLSNIFVSDYTHWMPLPNPPEMAEDAWRALDRRACE